MAELAPDSTDVHETLEKLQARHRKEHRDLVARITQKKKQATKKTRKGVNDECERLKRELEERQEVELATLNGDSNGIQDESEDDFESEGAALDINDNTSQTPPTTAITTVFTEAAGKKKPNRAKARLARRAAEQSAIVVAAEQEAANAPNPREIERERMASQLEQHKLVLHEIRADGHCLYAAVADQLDTRELGVKPKITGTKIREEGPKYKKIRYAAADWIQSHPDDFADFMEDPLLEHVRKIRDTGEWGGHLELLALARTYGMRICVLHSDGRVDKIQNEDGKHNEQEIWLGYFEHSHGLGEHYNSLRKAP